MSTKIYYAYKVNPKSMNKFMENFDEVVIKEAAKKLRENIDTLLKHKSKEIEDTCKEKYEKNKDLWLQKNVTYENFFSEERKNNVALEMALLEIAKASFSSLRDPFCDIDGSFNAFLYEGDFYVIPYGDTGWSKQEFTKMEGVEDYCYWNNTDEPEGVSFEEWQERGGAWDKIALDDWEKNRLVHKSVDFKEGINVYKIIDLATSKNANPLKILDQYYYSYNFFKDEVEGDYWAKRFEKRGK